MQDEAILRDELKIMLDGTLYELIKCFNYVSLYICCNFNRSSLSH